MDVRRAPARRRRVSLRGGPFVLATLFGLVAVLVPAVGGVPGFGASGASSAVGPVGAVVPAVAPTVGLAAGLDRTGAVARTFFVSPHGNDHASGLTAESAWRSLGRASRAHLAAGDKVLLERGGTWLGGLTVKASGEHGQPITIGSYGTGAMPAISGACVTLSGDWISAYGLRTSRCTYAGFLVLGSHDTVSGVVSSHNISGVTIRSTALYASVLHDRMVDNNRMAPHTPGPNDDYGAIGVEVQGSHAHIAWNLISGSIARSHDYGTDGSAVEVYGARGTVVDHNRAYGDLAFTELGLRGTRNSMYAYNLMRSSRANAGFIVTRGVGDYFGPVLNTMAVHNTAVLTGKGSQDFWCGGVCDDRVLSVSDNIFEAVARIGYAGSRHSDGRRVGGRVGGGDNLFWGRGTTGGGVRRAASDRVANPHFASDTLLTLLHNSPAVDGGRLEGRWTDDVYGNPLPADDGRADIGAVAYQPAPSGS